ncbi:MAG: hypothetical protein WBA10_04780 [Elainellaceae cyanobacterium]
MDYQEKGLKVLENVELHLNQVQAAWAKFQAKIDALTPEKEDQIWLDISDNPPSYCEAIAYRGVAILVHKTEAGYYVGSFQEITGSDTSACGPHHSIDEAIAAEKARIDIQHRFWAIHHYFQKNNDLPAYLFQGFDDMGKDIEPMAGLQELSRK